VESRASAQAPAIGIRDFMVRHFLGLGAA